MHVSVTVPLMRHLRFVQVSISAALVLTGTFAASTGAGASPPVTLSATPNFIVLCAPDTKSTTTLAWDARGYSNGADLQADFGSGVYQTIGHVYGVGSSPEQVVYTGQLNWFRLHDAASGTNYPTISVNVQQNKCPVPTGPSSVTLPATRTLTTVKDYSHMSGAAWCWDALWTRGTMPTYDVSTLGGKIAIGFEHWFDAGQDPLPCQAQSDDFYRGGVGFDASTITTFINNHGLTSAKLKFRQDTGTQSCIDHVGYNSDPSWDSLTPGSIDVLPDGGSPITPLVTSASGAGFWGTADVSAPLGFSLLLNGGTVNPHLHFVFVGTDEDIFAQDNTTCASTISMLVLQLNGDH
jgi:hypothetical protein